MLIAVNTISFLRRVVRDFTKQYANATIPAATAIAQAIMANVGANPNCPLVVVDVVETVPFGTKLVSVVTDAVA